MLSRDKPEISLVEALLSVPVPGPLGAEGEERRGVDKASVRGSTVVRLECDDPLVLSPDRRELKVMVPGVAGDEEEVGRGAEGTRCGFHLPAAYAATKVDQS